MHVNGNSNLTKLLSTCNNTRIVKRLITIVGARPQFIKAATLSRAFSKIGINESIIHTGQHFDENMSDIFFDEMEIPLPMYRLDVNGLSHGAMTGRMIEGIETILLKDRPEGVVVYGDTNSTLAGAIAASKLHIPVIHIEAGLRSFNMKMPEEINRILTDRISSVLFCPTQTAASNLQNERFAGYPVKIFTNGDVMYDAALYYAARAENKSEILTRLKLEKFIVATIHRQENTDIQERIEGILQGLNLVNKSIPVVVPLHPRTKQKLEQSSIKPEFTIIPPVGYFDMIMLLKNCEIVITDSGGVQKEAYFFEKYCVTLRDQTEWVELIDNNFNTLVGADPEAIQSACRTFLSRNKKFDLQLYGNGNAAAIAAEEILKL